MPRRDSGLRKTAKKRCESCGLERHRRRGEERLSEADHRDGLFGKVEQEEQEAAGAAAGAAERRAGQGARGVQTVRGGPETRGHFQKGNN